MVIAALLALVADMVAPVEAAPGTYAYVGRASDSSIVMLEDVLNREFQLSIPLGATSRALTASPDGKALWVSRSDNAVSLVDIVTNTLVATIPVGAAPMNLALSPDGSQLYVANTGGPFITVVDTASRNVIGTIELVAAPKAIAFSLDGARAYVLLDASEQNLLEFAVADRSLLRTASLTNEFPKRMLIAPSGTTAYVSSTGSAPALLIVDLATLTISNRLSGVVSAPVGMALNGDASKLFVTSENATTQVSVIDLGSLAVSNVDTGNRAMLGEIGLSDGLMYALASGSWARFDAATSRFVGALNIGWSDSTTRGGTVGKFGNTVTGVVGSGNGSITSTVTVAGSKPASLAVTPAAGSQIASISTDACDGVRTGNTYTTAPVNTRNCTVSASFAPIPSFNCDAISSPGDRTAVNCTAVDNAGTLSVPGATCTAPAAGNVSCSGSTSAIGTSPSATLTLNGGSLTLPATPKFTVVGTVAAGAGSITSSQVVAAGATAQLTVSAQTGYRIDSITTSGCDGSFTAPTYTTAAITAACTVTVSFELESFPITAVANPVAGGSVSCSPNPVSFGGSSTCTAAPAAGYLFTSFSGDCTGASCVLSNIQSARSVTANFAADRYPIAVSVSPAGGGSVMCAPNPVPYGGNSSCTATAKPGFRFAAFSGDCAGSTCALVNVTATQTVNGQFVAVTEFEGPTATGTGIARASMSGGGPGCRFDASSTGFVLPELPASVTGYQFPHGLLRFRAQGCEVGATLRVTITWPSLDGLSYLQYQPANASHGITLAPPRQLRLAGNTVVFDVVDGSSDDDDAAGDGSVRNLSGPAAAAAPLPVPLGGGVALVLLSLLLCAVAARKLAPRPDRQVLLARAACVA